jgi:fucose permease
VPAFRLACLAYFSVALPGSTFGLLWPSIRADFHVPIAALGILLIVGTIASVIASIATGRLLARLGAGPALASGTALTAVALTAEALTPSLWMFAGGMTLFGLGSGAIDAALNAHAAQRFGARQINWIHASYGAGATVGPVLTAALLDDAVTWRWIYATMGMAQAVLALVFAVNRRAWVAPPDTVAASAPRPVQRPPRPARRTGRRRTGRRRTPAAAVVGSLVFTVVESGIEAAVGVWGYVFLTDGRGLTRAAAGVAVSAYWAMMFLGRVVLGALAERVGPSRVLGVAVVGVSVGCALMAVPGPGGPAVTGLLIVGLAAAPLFPLFTLTTAQRVGADSVEQTAQTVSLQVAASAVGGAALPAGIGLAIGAFTANALAPPLLVLSLTMCAVYGLLPRNHVTRGE